MDTGFWILDTGYCMIQTKHPASKKITPGRTVTKRHETIFLISAGVKNNEGGKNSKTWQKSKH